MVFECPSEGCNHTNECGHCLSVHYSAAHDGDLSKHDIDTSRTCVDMTGENNPAKSDEVGQKISDYNSEQRDYSHISGDDNPMKDIQVVAKVSRSQTGQEGLSGEDHPLYGVTGEDHPSWNREVTEKEKRKKSEKLKGHEPFFDGEHTEEHKRKISESLKGHEPYFGGSPPTEEFVEELGHAVTGSWEKWVAFALQALDVEYEREPSFTVHDGRAYHPDFAVGDLVIEVKGWPCGEFSKERAESFLDEHGDNYTYVAVGSELPCDEHVAWENRDELLEVVGSEVIA